VHRRLSALVYWASVREARTLFAEVWLEVGALLRQDAGGEDPGLQFRDMRLARVEHLCAEGSRDRCPRSESSNHLNGGEVDVYVAGARGDGGGNTAVAAGWEREARECVRGKALMNVATFYRPDRPARRVRCPVRGSPAREDRVTHGNGLPYGAPVQVNVCNALRTIS
jgi:hypothetical protein